ncbi:MAG: hypothetical protein ABI539_07605, partial [Acidobacteriota bacterium]
TAANAKAAKSVNRMDLLILMFFIFVFTVKVVTRFFQTATTRNRPRYPMATVRMLVPLHFKQADAGRRSIKNSAISKFPATLRDLERRRFTYLQVVGKFIFK